MKSIICKQKKLVAVFEANVNHYTDWRMTVVAVYKGTVEIRIGVESDINNMVNLIDGYKKQVTENRVIVKHVLY